MVALTKSTLAFAPPRVRRVGVVLNVNARKVDAETLAWISKVVPERDLFVSRSVADVPRLAEQLIADRYDAVLWGGGDGTFVAGVAALTAAAEARHRPLPHVGVLRLGTGNAVAESIGAAPATQAGLERDLHRARYGERRELAMLNVEGQPTMFCGFGLDAQILDDFGKTVGMLKKAGVANALKSANARYFVSVTSRSLPRFLLSSRAEVVAVNRGAPAIKVDVDGNQIGAPVPAGRVLWRGRASLAAASTIPFYGLGLRMFPHAAREPGRFQLRVSDAGTMDMLSHLPGLWKGQYQGEQIHDYLVDKVELVLSRPAPFQSGGDVIGERGGAMISLWRRPISVV